MVRTKEEIEKEIIKFLDESSSKKADPSDPHGGIKPGIACALGTSKNNIPRVTPIDFYNDGLTLWMTGDPGEKLATIRANPTVSVGIYNQIDRSEENRSIMLKGKASLVTKREQEELYMEVITKLGILDMFKKAVQSGISEKRPDLDIPSGEDFETQLDKLMNIITMIKVEPELIALLIIQPGGAAEGPGERLVWEKER
jgi:nitroimidazol reductase NimA-like FMN-containing flavoprotein (pyridoxamine 5'-phosphate oxidase superfamily)